MGFHCGIVGLPNVGKSTLFNALTATAAAQAANYPFCTIEPNTGRVSVPDARLDILADIAKSQKIIPTPLEFVDIAGLVRGASQGQGLGNQFLGHIRATDAVIHVLRCFEDGDITHVEGDVDPLRDLTTIETELLLADIESLQKRLQGLEKKAKTGDTLAKAMVTLIGDLLPFMENGRPARAFKPTQAQAEILEQMQLLTAKPMLYACNVKEHEAATGNAMTAKVLAYAKEHNTPCVIISAAIESEVSLLEDAAERKDYLESLGLTETGLNQIVREGYGLLGLITFFTIGPKEARAWTVTKGTKAPQAAGVIHTDFERGFICAETIGYTDYVDSNGEQGAKATGKMRLEGKEYVVQDGDVFHFRFAV